VAQWLAYALPCRRFAPALADDSARLGADVDRYSFIVVDLHHLLLAGLPAHAKRYPSMPKHVAMGIASLHPSYDITSRSRGALRPSFASSFALSSIRGRREDRVLAAPAVSRAICANKCAHEHTGQREHSGLPCAMALRLTSCSSRADTPAQLSASTAAPEPHDFAVRFRRVRLSRPQRPPHLTARS